MITSARYLLRFDDICPTMDWQVWDSIESILNESGIKPILAVVPDNQDEMLCKGPARTDFWEKVRRWQQAGWTIGLHGYHHKMANDSSGILGITRGSEFAGLSYEEQHHKIARGLEIFRQQGVTAEVWVAPRHSFDRTTLEVLSDLNLTRVSDGLSLYPYHDSRGMFWIPQQLWRFRVVPFGVWTVCVHPNGWSGSALTSFARDIERFRKRISSFDEVVEAYESRPRAWHDQGVSLALFSAIRAKKKLRKILRPAIEPV